MTDAPMRVPLVDLRAGFAPIRREVLTAIEGVLEGMELFLGPNVVAFEEEFARYCGAGYGIGVSSGTSALTVALRAAGVEPGDEVIVPALTFFATVEAVVQVGAVPVLVDVEPETLALDPNALAAAHSARTRAIVPVHLFGQPADMDAIGAFAAARDLRVVEDAAQAHGAEHRGRRCGSLGDAGCFSFYVSKNLGAYGEGGFVTTNDAGIADTCRALRDHGQRERGTHRMMGDNLRLDEVQAAVLRVKLPRLDAANERRAAIADFYDRRFAGLPIVRLGRRPECTSVHHLYPLRVEDRDALAEALAAAGIGTGIHYAQPCHRQPALAAHPHRAGALPVAEEACRRLLSIPMYPELTEEQLEHVVTTVERFFDSRGGTGGRR